MAKGILWLSLTAEAIAAVKAAVNFEFPVEAKHFHCTLKFGVDSVGYQHLLGQQLIVTAMLSHHDDRVQALSVLLPEEIQEVCDNTHPHITLSMTEGTLPYASNVMLTEVHYSKWVHLPLTTIVEFFEFPPQ